MSKLFKHSRAKISTDIDFADAMITELNEEYFSYIADLDKYLDMIAGTLIAELKATSPAKTGNYRDAWKDEKTVIKPWAHTEMTLTEHTITNDETLNSVKYRTVPLAVVLEYGRHTKDGKITGKKPHINAAISAAEKKLIKKIGGK